MTALVSIIVPCYNAAPWIAATLESALAQTWPRCEIIVVDDGSRDDSLAIARSYTARGVRVIPQENRGASAARNHGISASSGDYLQFLDADDLLAPTKIAAQLDTLRMAPPGSIASGTWGRFDHDPQQAIFIPEENWTVTDPIRWLCLNFSGHGMMPPAAWLVPRDSVQAVGPWDERLTLNDDGEYFCRILLRSSGIHFCSESRTLYRSNLPGSLSRRRSEDAWRSAFLSHELCEHHLLATENSAQTRQACADLYQRLAYAIYPDCPSLVAACEDRAKTLGGSTQRVGGGHLFRLVTRLFGWKIARRWQAHRARTAHPL